MRRPFRVVVAVVAPVALALLAAPFLRSSQAESAQLVRSTVPPTASPAPSKHITYPKAIALLREAKERTLGETRPDQRDILLCQVAEWLNYAGDSETALQALREARELNRSGRDGSTSYGRMQQIATLMADCGDTRTALETARMAESEQERKWAIYDVATHLAKRDVRSGAWEALADISEDSHRQFTIREISEAAIRANDFGDLHRAIAQMPPTQQTWFAEEMAKRLDNLGRKEEAREVRNRYPQSAEQKKALESPAAKFFQDLYSGKPVDIAEMERLVGREPNPLIHDNLLVTASANLYHNGKEEAARRLWNDLANRIEKRGRKLPDYPIDFPGDNLPAILLPREDIQVATVAEDLSRCSLYLGRATPEGASLFLNLALKAAHRIDTLPLHTQTLTNTITNCLTMEDVGNAVTIARQLRESGGRARELCRIAREQIWIEDKKRALVTLREAELMTNRTRDLRERADLLCILAIARKRAGDLPGARRAVERAEGNFNEIADWQRDIFLKLSLIQIMTEVDRVEDARKVLAGIKDAMPQVWALVRMANAYLPDERPLRRTSPGLL